MAATTGFALLSMTSNIVQSVGACTALGVLNSRISAPAEKARPAPVITIAVTAGCCWARGGASTQPARVPPCRPLTRGGVVQRDDGHAIAGFISDGHCGSILGWLRN